MRRYLLLLPLVLFCSCKPLPSENQMYEARNENFIYSGRTLSTGEGTELITSAASVKTSVLGDTVTVFLKSSNDQHQYVAVELNKEYLGRFKIEKDQLEFALPDPDSANLLSIYKETEASNGSIIFSGLQAERIEKPTEEKLPKIEFIGDSITCGMGADTSAIDCEEGEWFDQHSAYMTYGAQVARALNVDFELNCVSGMGMYRNWNDEDQPVMPDVYPDLYLKGDSEKTVEVNKEEAPDIVSIALGTNDLSLGDGEKERSPFNAEEFKRNYIGFINYIYDQYPETQVALLSSPMAGEEEGKKLIEILQGIRSEFTDRRIEIFQFNKMDGAGCTGHPSVEDHQIMAEKLIPFYRQLLRNK